MFIATSVNHHRRQPQLQSTTTVVNHHLRQPPPSSTTTSVDHHRRQPQLQSTTTVVNHHLRQPPPSSTTTSVNHHLRLPPPPSTTTVVHHHRRPPPPPSTTTSVNHHRRQPPPPSTTTSVNHHRRPPPLPSTTTVVNHHLRQPPPSSTTTSVNHHLRQQPPSSTTTSVNHHLSQPPPSSTTTDSYGPCSNTTCGESNCVTDYGGTDRCVGAVKVCGVPPETHDTDVTYEGRYINARAHHTCRTDFRPCTDKTTRVCQPTGEWSNASTVCGQFRWHNATVPFDKAIPCGGGPTLLVHIHGLQPSEGGISMVLSSGDSQLLGVTCSYESYAQKVVINTILNGTHGDPKSIEKYPLTIGKMFNMTLSLNNVEYMVDGTVVKRSDVQVINSPHEQMEVVCTYLGRMSSSPLMLYTAAFIIAVSGQDPDSPLLIVSQPTCATDGERFTLSCEDSGGDITTARWYRNCTEVFQTSHKQPNKTLNGGTFDRIIAGRITVDANLTRHNIMLEVNSTLDKGSQWSCRNEQKSSNELTVSFFANCTDSSDSPSTIPMTTSQTTSETNSSDSPSTIPMTTSQTTSETKSSDSPSTIPMTTSQATSETKFLLLVTIGPVGCLAFIICVAVTVGVVCVRRMTGGRASGKQMKHEEGPEDQGTGPPANAVSLNVYTYCDSVGGTPYRKETAGRRGSGKEMTRQEGPEDHGRGDPANDVTHSMVVDQHAYSYIVLSDEIPQRKETAVVDNAPDTDCSLSNKESEDSQYLTPVVADNAPDTDCSLSNKESEDRQYLTPVVAPSMILNGHT
ncbi:uncharacterized protein [Haliotis cracherodii]|uniref:uncharacterized protein n=1 Tax=Haliotis cracherodii TaxID=6455 RepID=UPI0039EB8EB3